MKLEVPKKVQRIIRALQEHGYDAYAVGGCVRDSLLNRSPADWDITTSAKPMEVKNIFKRTVDTGLQHGTVTVLMEKEGFEVTAYRIDGEYEDSRHPKEVIFTENLEEDLKRRDFTINAMAYNEETGLVDVFGGIRDLDSKIVRCVGNPQERFTEDALRILRAVRFSAQLGFTIEKDTAYWAKELAPTLEKISAERIQTELVKLLVSAHPQYLKTAWELGITKIVLPEFDVMMETPQNTPHHCYSVGEHTLKALEYTVADKVQRLAVLFHDMGKPAMRTTDEQGLDHFCGHPKASAELARKILRRLRFDNDTIRKVTELVFWHECPWECTPRSLRRALSKMDAELFPVLLKIRRADVLAQSEYRREEKLERLEESRRLYEEIQRKQECISVKMLAVSGKDLIAAGMKPGKEIGDTLNAFLELVLEEPEKNTKEYLLSKVRESL
ncbi:MAG TPA: CCA tRNA nucleotidyltransferase [Candidatus Blautia stercoravium]|nr:CCA tRNA nucleotidyltransferase [Candidatus Blautia stercoravium]